MEQEAQPTPKVSVLIVSWNSAGALRRCLESLERSVNRESIEIIVVDNGSLDESPRMDAEYPHVTMLRLPRNFGIVKALNIGMRTAKGEFFFFLRPEMEVFPETVSTLAARLEAAADAAAVSPLLVDPDGQSVSRYRRLPTPQEVYLAWRNGGFSDWSSPDASVDCLAAEFQKGAALMVRGHFLRGMRYIDGRYGNSWWDLEVCHQIRRASKKILLLPGVSTVLNAGTDPGASLDGSGRALLSADCALGAATFAGKHYGWGAGFKVRFSATFHAFFQTLRAAVRFRDTAYHFSRFTCLLSGQKIDGSQRAL